MTSDDRELDDEAPPDIPDIDSSPMPLRGQRPPVSAERSQMLSSPELTIGAPSDIDIDVEMDVERISAVEVEPEPVASPGSSRQHIRERNQTAPHTPVARASAPPPPGQEPAPPASGLKAPPLPSTVAARGPTPAPASMPQVAAPMPGEPVVRDVAPPPPRARMPSTPPPDLERQRARQPSYPTIAHDVPPRPQSQTAPDVQPPPAPRPASVPPPRPPSQPEPPAVSRGPLPRPTLRTEPGLEPVDKAQPGAPPAAKPISVPPPRPASVPPRSAAAPPRPPKPKTIPPPSRAPEAPTQGDAAPTSIERDAKLPDPPAPRPASVPPARPSEPPGTYAATSYPPPPLDGEDVRAAPTQPAPPREELAVPAKIRAARIISVRSPGTPKIERPEPGSAAPGNGAATAPAVVEPEALDAVPSRATPLDAMAAVVEEIADSDIAPDSEELTDDDIATEAELALADGAAPEPEPEEDIAVVEDAEPEKPTPPKPPPRPKRDGREPMPTLAETPVTKQRRPWWEEVFGEDFHRATSRLKDAQIKREVNFVEESLGVAPGGVVLDLGCGAGHHAVELARRGYGVVGYDLSLFQLALAADVAQEASQKLNLLQGDMREMAFEEMFDGVFCWNTTFGYFEEEKNFAVAQRVFRALRPGGMFLLDALNRDYAIQQSPNQTWFEGDACVCMDDMSVDFITSRLKVKRSLILDDGRTRESTYSIRLYSLHELGKILHDVGFRVTEASGHPATPGVFFGAYSPRIIILAQRP
jgi:SAM-dependent methyltransferase